jgi:hypothetical protein
VRTINGRSATLVMPLCAGIIAASGGLAWAYWRMSGSATTTVRAGSAVQLRGTGSPFPQTFLYPGGAADLKVTIQNDNPFPVVVRQITLSPDGVVADSPHASAGCRNTGVTLSPPPNLFSWNVDKNSSRSFVFTRGVRMTNASDSACQGATFTLPLTLGGTSAS